MCVIVVLPPNIDLDKNIYRACFIGNSNGAGFGFYKNSKTPVLEKGFASFKEFWERFETVRNENKDKTFLIHFRIRTHGANSAANTHPFQLKNALMAHNGVLYGLGEYATTANAKSDTAEMAELVNDVHTEDFEALGEELSKEITGNNAIAFLTRKGKIVTCGSNKGVEVHGAWFSNDNWKYTYERLIAKEERERGVDDEKLAEWAKPHLTLENGRWQNRTMGPIPAGVNNHPFGWDGYDD